MLRYAPQADAVLTAALALVRAGLYPAAGVPRQAAGAGGPVTAADLAEGYTATLASLHRSIGASNGPSVGAAWAPVDREDQASNSLPTDEEFLEGTFSAVAALSVLAVAGTPTAGCMGTPPWSPGQFPPHRGLGGFFDLTGSRFTSWPAWGDPSIPG